MYGGSPVIQHWNEKIRSSQTAQNVINSYEGILLKNREANEYVYCEYPLNPLDPNVFSWAWAIDKKTGGVGAGLQGSIAGKTQLVWYKNQKQLFRSRTIPAAAIRLRIERTRLTIDRYVETIFAALQTQTNTQDFVP